MARSTTVPTSPSTSSKREGIRPRVRSARLPRSPTPPLRVMTRSMIRASRTERVCSPIVSRVVERLTTPDPG